jgi:AAA+ superfamily predicted ATPase
MSNPEGVARHCNLPHAEFDPAWDSIMLAEGTRERLLAQSLLSFTIRQKLPFEAAPMHGLILLTGAPGTGKTTLARGLANQVAKQLKGAKCKYVEVDPHALMSSSHGRSQQAVAKLFEHTIPEMAVNGAAIVLLDEVETLAVSRHQLSLDANPIDVHRATDAALAGLDRLTRVHRNVLLIATTNFPKALDSAVLSRADHIEEIGLPNLPARREIIADTLQSIGKVWTKVSDLEAHADRLAKVADGLDGRRIRKEIFSAIGSDIETAKDPNRLTVAQIEAAFGHSLKLQKEMAA